jgi:hypothetical protein
LTPALLDQRFVSGFHSHVVLLQLVQGYGKIGFVIDSAVFQRTVDWPEEFAPGYHVVLEDGTVVTVRWDQVKPGN